LKLLLDTNVLIQAEPTEPSCLEEGASVVSSLLNAAAQGKHGVFVHPASVQELLNDKDAERCRTRTVLVHKYLQLVSPPRVSAALEDLIGRAKPGSHDEVDHALLAAVSGNAVDFLVTADHRLKNKALRADLGERVATPSETLRILKAFQPKQPTPPPAVRPLLAHELDESDPIFESLRQDYEGFDHWLKRCKLQHRHVFVVFGDRGAYDGICILKPEASREHGLEGNLLKVCTLKVSSRAFGKGYGELLLKAVFDYCLASTFDSLYVEVLEKHGDVISLLEEFDFAQCKSKTARGELVLAKKLTCSKKERQEMHALGFNVKYGPHRLKVEGVPVLVIPIQPIYHAVLFPDAEEQADLFPGSISSGNAIRKAYLSHASIGGIEPGSVALFYRSRDKRAVSCIGVIESVLRSRDPMGILRYVGKRTVYSFDEIEWRCKKEVLCILFRHAMVLRQPIGLKELKSTGLLTGHPQSIVRAYEEGVGWLQSRLDQ